jgi:hypothetical protein
MLNKQEEDRERRETLLNDQRVREQSGTFLSHTHMDEGGRFAQVTNAYVVGSTALPQYPQASAPFQCDPVPDEPPLGLDNPALEPPSVLAEVQATSAPVSEAPSSIHAADVEPDTGARSSRPYRRY